MVLILLLLLVSLVFSSEDKLDPQLKLLLRKERAYPLSPQAVSLRKVIVLKKSGKVEVVDLGRRSLRSLLDDPEVVYLRTPRKLFPQADRSFNSTFVINGSSSAQVRVNYSGHFFGYVYGGSVSGDGCSMLGSYDYGPFQCTSGTTLSVSKNSGASNFTLFLSAPYLKAGEIETSLPKYLVGTRANGRGKTGAGVIAGVIDTGINFCHPAFRNPDGTTRVLFYKDYEGREFSEEQINQKIRDGDCNYDSYPYSDEIIGHGTRVASLIGGYWDAVRFNSPAKDVKFVIYRTNFYDDDIIEGLNYIKQKARELGKPTVVNLSWGGHSGPHDGTDPLDRVVDELSGSGFVVVVAAGNVGDERLHARVSSSFASVPLVGSAHFIEGWYDGGSAWRVEVCSESSCVSANPSETKEGSCGSCSVSIENTTLSSPLNGDGTFYLEVSCPTSSNLNLKLTRLSGNGKVDLWEVGWYAANGRFGDYFIPDGFGGYSYTVSTPGTSKRAITVGAINVNSGTIVGWSSRGPTRDGRIKPEVVASGTFVCVATSRFNPSLPLTNDCPNGYYTLMGGTSASTPIVSSLVALYLEDHPNATPEEVRGWLIGNATNDLGVSVPNYAYGYGKAVYERDETIVSGSGGSGSGGSGGSGGSTGGSGGGFISPPPSGGSGGGGGCSVVGTSSSNLTPVLLVVVVLLLRRVLTLRARGSII